MYQNITKLEAFSSCWYICLNCSKFMLKCILFRILFGDADINGVARKWRLPAQKELHHHEPHKTFDQMIIEGYWRWHFGIRLLCSAGLCWALFQSFCFWLLHCAPFLLHFFLRRWPLNKKNNAQWRGSSFPNDGVNSSNCRLLGYPWVKMKDDES